MWPECAGYRDPGSEAQFDSFVRPARTARHLGSITRSAANRKRSLLCQGTTVCVLRLGYDGVWLPAAAITTSSTTTAPVVGLGAGLVYAQLAAVYHLPVEGFHGGIRPTAPAANQADADRIAPESVRRSDDTERPPHCTTGKQQR